MLARLRGRPGGPSGEGKLFGLYIEVEGSGVVIKLPGYVTANPLTGQLQATFRENPQFPFSELDLHLHGGPRAPLANPQTCGSYATTSTLSSWAGQEVTGEAPTFNIDWDGRGGACPPSLPFGPGFLAGTITPIAGGFSPFGHVLAPGSRTGPLRDHHPDAAGRGGDPREGPPLRRSAGERRQLRRSEPDRPHATSPSARARSRIWVEGKVYLTAPYKGAPFGLSVVAPAKAGPFNLGNVIVRATIHVDPNTAAVTARQRSAAADHRRRAVADADRRRELNRPGFVFNPTNCSPQSITATITSAQGTSASVSSPFAVAGCASCRSNRRSRSPRGAERAASMAQPGREGRAAARGSEHPQGALGAEVAARLALDPAGRVHGSAVRREPVGCPAGSVIGTGTAVTRSSARR